MERYIKIPNLPENRVSLAVVDGRIPRDIEENLYKREIRLIKTRKINSVYKAISYHPDIMMCHIGENSIVVAKNIPNLFLYDLEREGFNIIFGEKPLGNKYPEDVYYNVCVDKDVIICNERFTDRVLLEIFSNTGKRIINVEQGYTKCSTLIVSSNIFVTSDRGIHNILIRENKKALLISPGYIDLFNMNYGFIGGASGKLSSKELGFLGDIYLHEDAMLIDSFLDNNRIKPVSLSKNKLIDLGTLIPLKEYNDI